MQKAKSKKNGGERSTWLEKNEKGGVVGWQLKSLEDVRCKEEEKKAEEDEEKEWKWSLKPERLRQRGNRERMEWEFYKILRIWEDINLGNVFFFFEIEGEH